MSPTVTSPVASRRVRLIVITFLLLLLAALTAGPGAAQDEVPMEGPTATEAEPGEAPVVLSEIHNGDRTTLTIEIKVGADTYTASGQPNTNFESAPDLRLGFNTSRGNGAERTFLFFDVTSIPANAVIRSALLRGYVSGFAPFGDTPMAVLARFLNSSWNPSTLTWNNFNPQWGAEIGVDNVPADITPVQADITGPVQDWVSGTRVNFGIMLQGDENPSLGRERIFHSRNANNNLHPRLIVTYDIDNIPPTSGMTALPPWSVPAFTVTWSGVDNPGGLGIRHFDVQVRANGGAWQTWLAATPDTSATYNGQNGVLYEFRVRATDKATPPNVQPFPERPQATTRVDGQPPNVAMNPLPQFTFASNFTVSWGGIDPQPGSGINHFDVDYQLNGGAWQPFAVNTTSTSGQVLNARNGDVYGFRARGVDNVGNVQPHSLTAQTSTTVSTANPTARIIPFASLISNVDNFLVRWTGIAGPGSAVVNYDVRYRFENSPWQTWLSAFAGSSAVFDALQGDGVYEFEVRARDSVGRVGDWAGKPGNSIAVDRFAPRIVPRMYAPLTPASP